MNRPPKWADRFLEWFCRDELLEEVRGDLHEFYRLERICGGKAAADWRYWYHVMQFMRPFAFKRFSGRSNHYAMFKNSIKLSWRNMQKHKGFAAIHLIGLVTGITSTLFILAYVGEELSVDRFHANRDSVFRVETDIRAGDTFMELNVSSGALGPALKNDMPGVEAFVRMSKPWSPLVVKRENRTHFEEGALYADKDFFRLFSFDLSTGNAGNALDGPGRVVLSAGLARKYFGDANPLGQQLLIKGQPYQVTGVIKEDHRPSHLSFDMLISYDSWIRKYTSTETNWGWKPATTYLLLDPEASSSNVEEQFPDFVDKYMPDPSGEVRTDMMLRPLTGLYFGPDRLGNIGVTGNKKQLYLLLSAALLIIVLALSNFVNLSSARATGRMKEVGVRKVVGAQRRQLIRQFFTESIMFSVLALFVSMGLLLLLWPSFTALVEKPLSLAVFLTPAAIGWLLLASLVLGLLAGIYPALVMSGFRPIDALKSKVTNQAAGISSKKVMLTFQFVISLGLLMVTLVMWDQFRLIQNQELGFYKDKKIVADLGQNPEIIERHELIRQELLSTGLIEAMTFSSHVPGEKTHSLTTQISRQGRQLSAEIWLNVVDMDFIENYGLQLVAGRGFSKQVATDTAGALILNESAVTKFGLGSAEQAIGLEFNQWGRSGKVIGVVKDFNQESLHSPVEALSFQVWPGQYQKATITLATNDFQSAVSHLEERWQDLTNTPFNYAFLEARLNRLYASDERFGTIFRLFTGLSLLITCLGLVGFAAYTVKMKTREMAIRKVLGAKRKQLMVQLVRIFIAPALLALALALLPSYWFLSDWLDQFAYRVSVGAIHFVLPLAALAVLVLFSVLSQSRRALTENPVNSLRNE